MSRTSHPLLDQRVEEALQDLDLGIGTLEVASRLRERLPAGLARAAAELHELRRRAAARLAGADGLLLTRTGLEQASDRRVAAARAARIAARLPGATVLDATAGIGGDALALAAAGLDLVAADRSSEAALLCRANLRRAGDAGRTVCADATRPPFRAGAIDVLVLDPDRRASGRRTVDAELGSPPLSEAARIAGQFRGACVQLAPALAVEQAERNLPVDLATSWQWVQLRGELKEVALWTGALAAERGVREVLALDDRRGRSARLELAAAPLELAPLAAVDAEACAWIAEPGPALSRAGLTGCVAREDGFAPLAADVPYVGGPAPARSPFLTNWRVIASAALDRKRVRALLRQHGVGPVRVHRRGHPEDAETLGRRLAGSGGRRGDLIVARIASGHRAWLVESS